MFWPASPAAEEVIGEVSRKPSFCSCSCSFNSASTVQASLGSLSCKPRSQSARWSGESSKASSRYGLNSSHWSGLIVDIVSSQRQVCSQAAVEINARLLPLALHGTLGEAMHVSDLSERETA